MRIFADDKVQLEMKKIRLVSAVILMVTFISCGNKSRQAEPIIYDDQPVVELSDSNTISTNVQKETRMTRFLLHLSSPHHPHLHTTISQANMTI